MNPDVARDSRSWVRDAGLVLAILFNSAHLSFLLAAPGYHDFGVFWGSGRAWLQGQSAYLPIAGFPNLNPPHVVLLLAPLSVLSRGVALAVWGLASLGAALWTIRIVAPAVTSRLSMPGLVTFAAALSGTALAITYGQLAFVLALPAALSWRAMREGRDVEAGAWLGLCASAKPFLLLFPAYWLWRRQWRALAACLVVIAGCFLVGWAVLGVSAHREWTQALQSIEWSSRPANASILGLTERLFSGQDDTPLWPTAAPAPFVGLALVAACLALAVRALRHAGTDRAYLVLGVLGLLLSPLGWTYYTWLVIGPLAVEVFSWPPWPRAWAMGLLCVPMAALCLGPPGAVMTLTMRSVPFWATLVLLIGCARPWWRPRVPRA